MIKPEFRAVTELSKLARDEEEEPDSSIDWYAAAKSINQKSPRAPLPAHPRFGAPQRTPHQMTAHQMNAVAVWMSAAAVSLPLPRPTLRGVNPPRMRATPPMDAAVTALFDQRTRKASNAPVVRQRPNIKVAAEMMGVVALVIAVSAIGTFVAHDRLVGKQHDVTPAPVLTTTPEAAPSHESPMGGEQIAPEAWRSSVRPQHVAATSAPSTTHGRHKLPTKASPLAVPMDTPAPEPTTDEPARQTKPTPSPLAEPVSGLEIVVPLNLGSDRAN